MKAESEAIIARQRYREIHLMRGFEAIPVKDSGVGKKRM
jgi:hypothetical protein